MPELSFSNSNEYFQNLVKEAVNLLKENKLDEEGMSKLEKLAAGDGTVTLSERKFIDGLKNKLNVEKVVRGDFDSKHFTFYSETNQETHKYKNDNVFRNPLNDEIHDIGIEKFNVIMANRHIKKEDLNNQILNSRFTKNDPKLKEQLSILVSKLDSKEASMYLNELSVRKPELSNIQMNQLTSKLMEMTDTDYDNRIGNSAEMVLNALHDIAAPQDIQQSNSGTCAGASIQIQLALKNPTEYLKMLDTLATNQPYKTLKGDKITPNWTFTNENTRNNSKRTISAKVMQNSIMDFADGKKRDFDSSSKDEKINGGLSHQDAQNALSSLFKQPLTRFDGSYQYNQKQIIDVLKKSNPSYSNPIGVSMYFDTANKPDAVHMVNVVDINDKNLKIINPWGREEIIPLDEMKGRIIDVSADGRIANKIEKFNYIEANDRDFKNKVIGLLNNPETKDKTLYKMADSDKKLNIYLIFDENINNNPAPEPETQKAVLYLIDDLLSGSEFNAKLNYQSLKESLELYGVSLNDIFRNIQINDPVYQDIINKLNVIAEDDNDLKGFLNGYIEV